MPFLSNTAFRDETQRKPVWHSDLKTERRATVKMTLIAAAIALFCLYTIQSVYFGANLRQPENTYRLTVRVLDLDSQYAQQTPGAPAAIMGPAMTQAVQQRISNRPGFHLGWQIAGADELSMFALTPDGQGLNASQYASDLVADQTVFGAVVVHANATVLATQAAQQGISTYDPRGSISFYYSESRNLFSVLLWVDRFVTETLAGAIGQASSSFAAGFIDPANATALTTAAPVIAQPFSYIKFNLVPFDKLAAVAPTTAGTIYLIILTFFITPLSRATMQQFRQHLTLLSELLLTIFLPILLWLWVSLCYSLVTLAFHVPMQVKYGHRGFPLFWMLNWVTMSGLGLVMEIAFSLLGPLGFPFFLVFWVVINVSVAFIDVADQDPFYMYAYVSPVWNAVDGSKSILLGTKNHLTQNFVVNLGWVIVAGALLCVLTTHQRNQRLQSQGHPGPPAAVKEKESKGRQGNGAA